MDRKKINVNNDKETNDKSIYTKLKRSDVGTIIK